MRRQSDCRVCTVCMKPTAAYSSWLWRRFDLEVQNELFTQKSNLNLIRGVCRSTWTVILCSGSSLKFQNLDRMKLFFFSSLFLEAISLSIVMWYYLLLAINSLQIAQSWQQISSCWCLHRCWEDRSFFICEAPAQINEVKTKEQCTHHGELSLLHSLLHFIYTLQVFIVTASVARGLELKRRAG